MLSLPPMRGTAVGRALTIPQNEWYTKSAFSPVFLTSAGLSELILQNRAKFPLCKISPAISFTPSNYVQPFTARTFYSVSIGQVVSRPVVG